MKLTVTQREMEKARRHVERREATAEIAQLIGVPARQVRQAASTMSTERVRRWLRFEQHVPKPATKPVQASMPARSIFPSIEPIDALKRR